MTDRADPTDESTNPVQELSHLLESEHREIVRLLEAVQSSQGEGRAVAFDELRRYLAVHEAAELAGLHALTGPPAARDRLAEERAATTAIGELEGMDQGSSAFDDAFTALAKEVRAHAAAEEHEELPTLLKGTSSEQVGRAYDALAMVRELVAQPAGPIPDGTFEQMHEAAVAELEKVASQGTGQPGSPPTH